MWGFPIHRASPPSGVGAARPSLPYRSPPPPTNHFRLVGAGATGPRPPLHFPLLRALLPGNGLVPSSVSRQIWVWKLKIWYTITNNSEHPLLKCKANYVRFAPPACVLSAKNNIIKLLSNHSNTTFLTILLICFLFMIFNQNKEGRE